METKMVEKKSIQYADKKINMCLFADDKNMWAI